MVKEQVGDKELSLTTITWDAQDEMAYCTWYDGGFKFGCMGIDDPMLISIGTPQKRLVAMASHSDGTLYGIDETGALVTINKQTGKTSRTVGNTGVISYWRTSATIDSQNDIMYYIDCGSNGSALYAVDLDTAVATKLYDFANSEQLLGLYVAPDETPGTVPGMPENVAMNFSGSSLSGTVTFDVPSEFYNGTPGTGDISYSLTIDEGEPLTGAAAWGETCTVPVTLTQPGNHTFAVSLTNATGASPAVTVSGYVGSDAPAAVTGASATYSNGVFTIKWTAPTAGANGGYLDTSALTYKVIRVNDSHVVAEATTATQVTDAVAEPQNQVIAYTYTITPIVNGIEGESVTTSKRSIGYFIPPYSNDFATSSKTTGYTVVDANKDGKKWSYYSSAKAMRIIYNTSKPMDDWVFTPAMQLEAGRTYTFSFDARAHNNTTPERIAAAVSTGTSVASVVETIVEPTVIRGTDWVTLSGSFTPSATGRYRLGLHALSDRDSYYLYATNIVITAGAAQTAPAAISDLTAVADASGALCATVSMTAPSTDAAGNAISSLEKVELMRNGTLIHTFSNPTPGASLSYVDNEATGGNTVYSAVSYNASGASAPVQTSVFIGFAAPNAPTALNSAIGANTGQAVLSWTAPATDANGKALTSGSVTYDITRTLGENTETIATGVTACTYTDQAAPATDEQDFYIYSVTARTTGGASAAVTTGLIPLGAPYALPFAESFGNARISSIWGLNSSIQTAGWNLGQDTSIESITSEDSDNGLAFMQAMTSGSQATIYSGSIAIPADGNPTLCYAYFNYDSNNTLQVAVSRAGESEATVVSTVTMDPSKPAEWVNVPVNLSAYKGQNIQVYFTGTCVNTTLVIIDNVRIERRLDIDVALRSISMPSRVAAGNEYQVNAIIENRGLQNASGYSVELIKGGETVETVSGPALAPAAKTTVSFTRRMLAGDPENVCYQVRVICTGDLDSSNNLSETYSVRRMDSDFPALDAPTLTETDGSINVEWTAPDLTVGEMQPVTDDVEDYTPFSTGLAGSQVYDDYMGAWTSIDNDGVVPFTITSGGQAIEYPNSGRPVGFMAIDSSFFGLEEWNAHSGNMMFASFASQYAPNDDWLISEMLPGTAQTVSFWARSLTTMYGAESFQILYSTTDTKLSSFTRVTTVNNVPEAWTQYSYELPAGARYFAIRCVSDNTFAFFVDDITYTPAHPADGLVLNGYNIYRDGALITPSPVAATSFVDTEAGIGEHSYALTAVYNRGESAMSPAASIITTGIESIFTEGRTQNVYSVDGLLILRDATIGQVKMLPRGIYIIAGRKVII